jgi:RimJ/RimL family protein N-acetyltransferase
VTTGDHGGAATPPLSTDRLDLEPLTVEHADEMVAVLGGASLYAFIGGRPLTLDELRGRYASQARGWSTDRRERWHNWVVRRRDDRLAAGTVQATIDLSTGVADIAWVIGVASQGRGYAGEAAAALVRWLESTGIATITAHVHRDHDASARVAAAAGLIATELVEDGEQVWRRDVLPSPSGR